MRANASVSGIELRFRRELRAQGVLGYRVGAALPGRPDIVFPRARLAVFIHGCFWHSCARCQLPVPKANHDFWAAKFEQNRARDERVERNLAAAGWTSKVVWEHEIRNDLEGAVCKVIEHLRASDDERAVTSQ
jgi:DNA mismatch endonuclease (patch repair protein)